MANVAVEGAQKTALLQESDTGNLKEDPVLLRVAKAHQVSPLRQLREVLRLSMGWQKLRPKDYYAFGLFDPAMPMAEKRQYVGRRGADALNARLSPPELTPSSAFIGNKVLYSAMLRQMGLGAPETQAVVSTRDTYGALPVLADVEALKQFLMTEARYPVFGKRCRGSGGAGVARIEAVKNGEVLLGDGTRQALDVFCARIFDNFGDGYLLQTVLSPHPLCADITGSDTGCIRIVTVNDESTPRPVYALWKLPAPAGMSDNIRHAGAMLATVDLESGEILACRSGAGLETQDITHHPASGAQIVGITLPHWDDVKDLAMNAHALFPEFGLFGFDIAICDDGLKVVECSENPCHRMYQLATRRGIANRDLAPVWATAASRQRAQLSEKKARTGKRRHAKA